MAAIRADLRDGLRADRSMAVFWTGFLLCAKLICDVAQRCRNGI